MQSLLHSGGLVPHAIGGYKTDSPQWQRSSSKPATLMIL